MATKTKINEMEKAVRDLLTIGEAVWIPDENVDMSIFDEYPKAREGIAVYYPVYRDGSCVEPIYIKFFRSPQGLSIELSTEHEYHLQEKKRLGFLLRH